MTHTGYNPTLIPWWVDWRDAEAREERRASELEARLDAARYVEAWSRGDVVQVDSPVLAHIDVDALYVTAYGIDPEADYVHRAAPEVHP